MDEIVVKYDGDVKKLEDKLRSVEAEQLAIDKAAKKSTQTITKESDKAAASVQKVNKNVRGLKDSFNTLTQNLPFAGTIQQVTQLTSSLSDAGKSTNGLVKGMGLVKSAFAATGIGAFVALLGGLIAYFKSTEEGGDKLAKVMRVVGAVFGEVIKVLSKVGGFFVDVVEGISDYVSSSEDAAVSTDDYRKSVTELASEIADLEDKIAALTITVERQNDKLQTAIEINLKSLRRQNTAFAESQKIIGDIGVLEEQKLKNATDLINKKIALERKEFILKTNDFGADKDRILELQKLEKISLDQGNEEALEFARTRLKEYDDVIKKNRDKVKLFDQFIKDEITAETLLDNAKGTFTEEDAKRIAGILKEKESATRESLVLDERLENFRAAAAEKEKARIEKIKAEQEKVFQDKLKRVALEEKLAIGIAKIEEREETKLIDIQKEFNSKRIKLFQDNNRTREGEYQELILNQKTLEKEYTDFLEKEQERRDHDKEELNKKKLKEEQEFNDKIAKIDEEAGEEALNLSKENAAKAFEEIQKQQAKAAQIRQSLINEGIELSTQALNGLNDLQLANINAEVSNQRAANEAKTQSLLENLDKQNEAGVLSDAQVAAKKAKIQKDSAAKEAKLKEKLWKADQNAQLTRIAIDAAVGVAKAIATYLSNPLTAAATPFIVGEIIASAAIQAAFIKAQPVPKFEEGGKVAEGILKGKSHKNGGILIEAEGGERIFSKNTTKKYEPLFKSIQDGNFEKYAYENIARPAIKREQERQRKKAQESENLMKILASNATDTSHLERLTKSNKDVNIKNEKNIVEGIVKGFERALNKKSKGL